VAWVTKVLIALALMMKNNFFYMLATVHVTSGNISQQGILEEFMILILFQMHQSM
jgi:hypothetical protein